MKYALVFLVAAALSCGCTSPGDEGGPETPESETPTPYANATMASLPGDGWLCGSFRVNGSAAAPRMDSVIEAAKQAGFSFLGMITDPSRPEQTESCERASASGVLCIPCLEAGNDEGRLIGIGVRQAVHDNQSLEQIIGQVHEEGGVAYITHPMHSGNGTPWKRWDVTGWDGIAIVSPMTQNMPDDEKAISKWHEFLNRGSSKYAFGETSVRGFTSTYSLRNILDSSYQCVYIEGNLTEDSLKRSLLSGRFYVTNGPALNFTVSGAGPGEEARAEYGDEVRISIDVRSDTPFSRVRILKNGEAIYEAGKSLTSFNAEMNSTVTADAWFTAEIWGNDFTPEYHDFVHAFSNPVWVRLREGG